MNEYKSPSCPGKTAPRLLEDLLDYDPRRSKTKKYHLLTDPPPQYIDEQKLIPVRKDERDCRHELVIQENQSTGPIASDEKATLTTTYVISTYCSRCRYHFRITVDYTKNNVGKEPCVLGSNNPLHHFRYVPDKSQKPKDVTTDKYDGHIENHHFKCSNPKCPAVTEIKITPPRLGKEFVKQLTDPQRLEARYRAALKVATESDAPHRFDNDRMLNPGAAMYLLYQYLRDALSQKPHENKRVSTRNKKFMLGCGEDCDEMLKYLDFLRKTEEDEQVSIHETGSEKSGGSGESLYYHGFQQDFWLLPCIIPSFNMDKVHFLQDVMDELSQLIYDRRGQEALDGRFSYSPQSATKRLQRSFGCWDYPRKSRELDNMTSEHPHYASLGACEDFTDDLIIYCYFKQKRCDDENKAYYLDCLAGIATGRDSSELQVEVAKEDSSGELRLQTIHNAYKFFSIDPYTVEGDSHIIGVYRSRIESAPRQKDEARECLRIIAQTRRSTELEAVANDKSMSIEEAYRFLGVTSETAGDSVEAAAIVKSDDVPPSQVVKALRVIANIRNDPALHSVATGLEPQDDLLDLSQAYRTLQIEDQSLSDSNILMYYQSLMEKAMGQGSKDSYEKALRTIAIKRNSDLLLAKLDDPNAAVGPQLSTAEHPVGIRNIGNTCYLNSLLQFYYTVKPIRDIVVNFPEYRMEVGTGDVTKRVGGQVVGRGEIIKAQQFVEELGKLFSEMKTASTPDVKPTRRLAELALLSTELENTFRRKSISGAQNISVLSPPLQADMPAPFNFDSPPLPPSRLSPPISGSVDVEMVDEPPPYTPTDQGDTSSEATLVNSDEIQTQDINREIDSPMKDKPDENEGKNVLDVPTEPRYATPEAVEIINGVDPSEDTAMVNGFPPPSAEQGLDLNTPIQGLPAPFPPPPPIPPRNKPGPIDTASTNNETPGTDMLSFGSQQDVTEVIQNVLFRLSCAIKPITQDTDNRNEQIDQIRNAFYGQSTISLRKQEGWVRRQEDWNNLTVFPATNGTRTIYEALDVYFDPQDVEYENKKLRQYASIKKLPPILQILIQRTDFDKITKRAFKNQNWIAADETIYLDRYLESDSDSTLMARRREAWEWKDELRKLDARRANLEETSTTLNVPESLTVTAEALKSIQEEEMDGLTIDPILIDSLEARADDITRELANINSHISSLKKRLDDQFTDSEFRKHKYTLQAAFIHRGTSGFGHYYIYIYDFATHVWREYNDESVKIVHDTTKIFLPDTHQGNKATPYYLVYVDDEQKDQLVDAVCRDLRTSTIQRSSNIALSTVTEVSDEPSDEGIDMGEEDGGGTSVHIERVSSRSTLKRPAPEHYFS